VFKKLTEAVQKGNFLSTAARSLGLNHLVVQDWVERGLKELHEQMTPPTRFQLFAQVILEARAKGEVALVKMIRDEADYDWHAAAFLLTRGYAKSRWAASTSSHLQVGGAIGVYPAHEVFQRQARALPPARLEGELERMQEVLGEEA